MKTGRLTALLFLIACPFCKEPLRDDAGRISEFKPKDVEPGQRMQCTNPACKLPFRLPTKLEAAAE
ncbi:MAG TPA: hypothetical protein VGB98_25800 [Pyrinomonadaceae bacterium]|jgi:uncharacterized protein YbaR (Trm112 family)